jgi:tetratricopeptide (TPR) repeat protein
MHLNAGFTKCAVVHAAKSRLEAHRDSLTIAERLTKADPGNARWQRDLAVSYSKVGDVLEAQGKLDEALEVYREDLAITERLTKADPGNAGWQRGLSISYSTIGDVLVAQGNLTEALQAATASPSESASPRPTPATSSG